MKSPLVLASDLLRISFLRPARDRFGHTIELIVDGTAYPMLASVEGTAEESWPASPPFQEAHLEQRPDGRQVVLLVGMAGNSHWSASAEIDPRTGAAVFDIACRMRGKADWLGSRYAIAGDRLPSEAGRIRLAPRPSPELAGRERSIWLELATAGDPAGLVVEAGELRVAAGAGESASAHTVRWSYTVRATALGPNGTQPEARSAS